VLDDVCSAVDGMGRDVWTRCLCDGSERLDMSLGVETKTLLIRDQIFENPEIGKWSVGFGIER